MSVPRYILEMCKSLSTRLYETQNLCEAIVEFLVVGHQRATLLAAKTPQKDSWLYRNLWGNSSYVTSVDTFLMTSWAQFLVSGYIE